MTSSSSLDGANCPFCSPDPERIAFESELVLGLWDKFQVSAGHLLLVPRRHVVDWFSATAREQAALWQAVTTARDVILDRHLPDGFNVGMNLGHAAGQTVPHLHLHVIPRYRGDVEDPTGGVRGVIPHLGNYRVPAKELTPPSMLGETARLPYVDATAMEESAHLVRGGLDPFLPHLTRDLVGANALDLAVAFVMPSGVDEIESHLRDILGVANHRVRLLTGDYLGITDPNALARLMDLQAEMPGTLQLRVFETKGTSFHPKAYLIYRAPLGTCAYVGSSNLSRSALLDGVEWNYRFDDGRNAPGVQEASDAFEELFHHPSTTQVTEQWLTRYRDRRNVTTPPSDVPHEPLAPPPVPHQIQADALLALLETRKEGNKAGLVVMATGLGKTYLSAFDVRQAGAKRLLFVAHREEILQQARRAFRHVFPEARLGLLMGSERDTEAEYVFASIQTLSRAPHLQRFERGTFDYIVVDEFHHADAPSYRRVLDHFDPAFLLGLTATPDRTDGGDLLALCDENEVYRCDVAEAIRAGFLAPFQYFGVPDDVDYSNIPWRSARFDDEALTNAWATQARAANALEQWESLGGERTLAFCCSQRHARFMREYFQSRAIRCAAVFAGEGSDPRAESLRALEAGELDVVFAVDMFNEGVDVPAIDTVFMLRPTESRILWLQQLGRGLRKTEGKDHLRVIDYIGNHRTFLMKIQSLLLALGDEDLSDGAVRERLRQAAAGELALPPGCEVTYDVEVIDVLTALLRPTTHEDALRQWARDFRVRHDKRPRAHEAFHAGVEVSWARKSHGSWLGFLSSEGMLSERELRAWPATREFFQHLEVTPMTKSFKMLTLLAMLNLDALPGTSAILELAAEFRRLSSRSSRLRNEVECDLDDAAQLSSYLVRNPLTAWAGGKGSDAGPYFALDANEFRSTFTVPADVRETWQELARELVDWRLAQYQSRSSQSWPQGAFTGRLRIRDGQARIEFAEDGDDQALPIGVHPVRIAEGEGELRWEGRSIVAWKAHSEGPESLLALGRTWFGDDAGLSGRDDRVTVDFGQEPPVLAPAGDAFLSRGLQLWHSYTREELEQILTPGQQWNRTSGMHRIGDDLVLLVTLEKKDMPGEHKYSDYFESPTRFHFQTQKQTRREGRHGKILRAAGTEGISVHLLVRKSKKLGGLTQGFVYCGRVTWVSWEGNAPISVVFDLEEAVPEELGFVGLDL